MKRFLPLLLAAILCLTAVSCQESGKGPSASAPEELSQSSGSPDAAGPEPQSDAPAVALSDAEKARLQALIDYYEDHMSDRPSWALGKKMVGDYATIDFYYDWEEDKGSRIIGHLPEQYSPSGRNYDFYVALEITAVAVGPDDGADRLGIVVSHDKGQTWDASELSVEEAGKYPYYHIAFRDESNGLLVFFDKENAVAYSTENGGSKWDLAGSFTPPSWFQDMCTGNGEYFIIGNNNGKPIVSKSADGVHWEERILPPDRDYDQLFCDYVVFDGNIGFAVVPRGINYATVDYGETWVFVKDLL